MWAWSAYDNDKKTLNRDLGYKCPLGILDKTVNGRKTAYNKSEDSFSKDMLNGVGDFVATLSNREKILIYCEYQDSIDTSNIRIRDRQGEVIPESIELIKKMRANYRANRFSKWSERVGGGHKNPKSSYNEALSRLKDKLYINIF